MDNGEVKALAELSTHVRYMREEIDGIKRALANTATKDDVAALRREIEANSPSSLLNSLTKIAVGIASFGAAVTVCAALLRWIKIL